jgi:hypothetical protein
MSTIDENQNSKIFASFHQCFSRKTCAREGKDRIKHSDFNILPRVLQILDHIFEFANDIFSHAPYTVPKCKITSSSITTRGWCSGSRISCIGCVCTSKERRRRSGELVRLDTGCATLGLSHVTMTSQHLLIDKIAQNGIYSRGCIWNKDNFIHGYTEKRSNRFAGFLKQFQIRISKICIRASPHKILQFALAVSHDFGEGSEGAMIQWHITLIEIELNVSHCVPKSNGGLWLVHVRKNRRAGGVRR